MAEKEIKKEELNEEELNEAAGGRIIGNAVQDNAGAQQGGRFSLPLRRKTKQQKPDLTLKVKR